MEVSKFVKEYELLLANLYSTYFFGKAAVTHYLKKAHLKQTGIGSFYTKNKLVYKRNFTVGNPVDVTKAEHPSICGGVTEYITKIQLARQLGKELQELRFFDDVGSKQYAGLTDEELAFAIYEPDIKYRSGNGYTREIFEHKELIIKKASYLANVALSLINKTFPKIDQIDFHPDGHVLYKDEIAIKGDSDLLINNCLIDFKTKKDSKLTSEDGAQLFAYALHKYIREGKNYDKVYILNPRFELLEELVLK